MGPIFLHWTRLRLERSQFRRSLTISTIVSRGLAARSRRLQSTLDKFFFTRVPFLCTTHATTGQVDSIKIKQLGYAVFASRYPVAGRESGGEKQRKRKKKSRKKVKWGKNEAQVQTNVSWGYTGGIKQSEWLIRALTCRHARYSPKSLDVISFRRDGQNREILNTKERRRVTWQEKSKGI